MVPFDLIGQAYFSDGLMTDITVRQEKKEKKEREKKTILVAATISMPITRY
jgi:hypothetical protein